MSDRQERGRIFERERRYKGLGPAEYLQHLAEESNKSPLEVLEELTGLASYLSCVYWYDLEHCDLFEEGFTSFSHGDSAAVLVHPQQLIDEIVENTGDIHDEETRPLILELANHGASSTLIGF